MKSGYPRALMHKFRGNAPPVSLDLIIEIAENVDWNIDYGVLEDDVDALSELLTRLTAEIIIFDGMRDINELDTITVIDKIILNIENSNFLTSDISDILSYKQLIFYRKFIN